MKDTQHLLIACTIIHIERPLIIYDNTRIKNGISNQKNISVAEVREELIATAIEQFSAVGSFADKPIEEKTKLAIE